jgi:hypothetical protein
VVRVTLGWLFGTKETYLYPNPNYNSNPNPNSNPDSNPDSHPHSNPNSDPNLRVAIRNKGDIAVLPAPDKKVPSPISRSSSSDYE